MKATLSGILFLICCPLLRASTHYVDSMGGNDGNDGLSQTRPWKTIAKVNAARFQPGDVILFRRGGLWREQLNVPSSGSAANLILIDAYDVGALPVISGADLVEQASWTSCSTCSAHVWQSQFASQPNVVLFDGIKGNKKSSRADLVGEADWFWDAGYLYTFSNEDPSKVYLHPGIEAGVRPSGVFLTGISNILLKNIKVTGANALPYGEGAGIWGATVHLTGPTADSLNIAHVIVVNCAGEGIHLENADHSTVDSSEIANNGGAGVKLYHSNAKFPVNSGNITNNEIHHNRFDGIFIVGCPRRERCRSVVAYDGLIVTGINISGNQVYNNGAGIYLHETNDSRVVNNTAYANTDTSLRGEGYCVGLSGSNANIVEKNTCYQARLSAIELSIDTGNPPFGSSDNIIRYNVIHDDGTHGIFTNYVPSRHNKIIYNLIYNHPHGACIMANYIGHEIYNNTCYNSEEGIHLYVSRTTAKTGNIAVKNNIIVKCSRYAVLIEPGVEGPLDFANNDYFPGKAAAFSRNGSTSDFAAWRANTGQDQNSILVEPQFSSPAPGAPHDFILRKDSQAIGKGVDLGADYSRPLAPTINWAAGITLSTQPDGHWDIGAFAHQ